MHRLLRSSPRPHGRRDQLPHVLQQDLVERPLQALKSQISLFARRTIESLNTLFLDVKPHSCMLGLFLPPYELTFDEPVTIPIFCYIYARPGDVRLF